MKAAEISRDAVITNLVAPPHPKFQTLSAGSLPDGCMALNLRKECRRQQSQPGVSIKLMMTEFCQTPTLTFLDRKRANNVALRAPVPSV